MADPVISALDAASSVLPGAPAPGLNGSQVVLAALILDGALNRIKSTERPTLSDAERRALVQSITARLQGGAKQQDITPELQTVLRKTKSDQDTAAADTKRKQAATAISTQAQPAPGATPTTAPGGQPTLTPANPSIPPSQVLATALGVAAANPPKLTDPDIANDPAAYRLAVKDWQDTIGRLTTTLAATQQTELGIVTLPDGSMIDTHDPRVERDPNLQAQIAAAFANQDQKAMDAYYGILNDLDLKDYAAASSRTNVNNAALSQGFQNALSAINTRVATGEANQNTAVKEISRQISGMSESRARAGQIEDKLAAQQGLAGQAGKTEYGVNDFGAAGQAAARYAGLPAGPNASVLNFTGQRTVDPAGLLAAGDQALGVTGQLSQIPGLGVGNNEIPQAPVPQLVGAAPQLRRPQAPVLPPRNIPPAPTASQLAPFLEDRINGGG